jgi:hypothetical protein
MYNLYQNCGQRNTSTGIFSQTYQCFDVVPRVIQKDTQATEPLGEVPKELQGSFPEVLKLGAIGWSVAVFLQVLLQIGLPDLYGSS